MANNRTCLTCGEAYEYCGSCPSSLNLPVWKNLFHSENCKLVFQTVSDYAQNVISKESAKEKLAVCDLSCTQSFKENIRKYIDEIVADESNVDVGEVTEPVEKIRRIRKKSAVIENID